MQYVNFTNLSYIDELYEKYLKEPSKVPESWRFFFDGTFFAEKKEDNEDSRVFNLIDAYRKFGHLIAKINPLEEEAKQIPELDLKNLGFSDQELKEIFPTFGVLEKKEARLEELITALKEIYGSKVGVEFHYSSVPELEAWMTKRVEKERFNPKFSSNEKITILEMLNKATLFEVFLHTKYVGQKRFSLEGGETLIPMLNEIIETGAKNNMQEFILGMSHRGRLNVLANIFRKSYALIFSEFEDFYDPKLTTGGDVKYHKGYSSNIVTSEGFKVHLSLQANPSHLEAVDPVLIGKTFAKQKLMDDRSKMKVIPVLIHGDASIAGQGVVYETLQLSKLDGYSTGGTIHIIVNNQIGFTTLPKDARSTRYASDIAKAFSAPVFHVNAEDPLSCIAATRLALEIRQKFHIDVFIDLNCYRKYGHNEGDEPFFTQPLQYDLIRQKKTIREQYRDKLISEGTIDETTAEKMEQQFKKSLHEELEATKTKKGDIEDDVFQGNWKKYQLGLKEDIFQPVKTGVSKEELKNVAKKFCTPPKDFNLHPKIAKHFQEKLQIIEKEGNIDWATSEMLAFSSLLNEKIPMRLAGQDSRRGTFSQRHALWVDQKTGKHYFPLSQFSGNSEIIDSPLSEYAALGFEFGYSLSYPEALVIWEAQYGDFSNGGQIISDQFISTSGDKWQRFSGLTLLLPHGYEGQGPEHSSARIERFLQLSGSENMQVAFPTMPAQYFHLLRRQVLRLIRKPLIVFTPKSLLRHPLCVSPLKDFSEKTFEEIIDDTKQKVNRVLFCTGKMYFMLLEERAKRKREDVAIVRIEQLYPIHKEKLQEILQKYKDVKDLFWVQEEPKNMGAWNFINPIFLELGTKLNYVGRERRAVTASGSHTIHLKEEQKILTVAFE